MKKSFTYVAFLMLLTCNYLQSSNSENSTLSQNPIPSNKEQAYLAARTYLEKNNLLNDDEKNIFKGIAIFSSPEKAHLHFASEQLKDRVIGWYLEKKYNVERINTNRDTLLDEQTSPLKKLICKGQLQGMVKTITTNSKELLKKIIKKREPLDLFMFVKVLAPQAESSLQTLQQGPTLKEINQQITVVEEFLKKSQSDIEQSINGLDEKIKNLSQSSNATEFIQLIDEKLEKERKTENNDETLKKITDYRKKAFSYFIKPILTAQHLTNLRTNKKVKEIEELNKNFGLINALQPQPAILRNARSTTINSIDDVD